MNLRKITAALALALATSTMSAQTGEELPFHNWALTPPMGWNSWDCFGPTVVESEVKANADYMAQKLLPYGWEYVVVDIRWYVENDKAGGYNQTNPIYVIDQFGRYTPAVNRFPSAADGTGFKHLADYVHSLGLKFGIHLMRGLPKKAVEEKMPVKGTTGITCDMIANNDSTCTWLRDNWKVDWRKEGAQQYYNSCFEMYADWGVDFVKIDDLARPYHTAEIEMIRHAIDNCGRPMVLSISPGETPIEQVDHVRAHANMWRTVDDFWDNWEQLNYQFQICEKWAPYIAPGTWPDADMLPLGRISIRGERGGERWTNFTTAEQYTMMNLWTIFKSPLMFGGHLPMNDAATDALLTNRDVLYMHHYSTANRQLSRDNDEGLVVWTADDPANGDKFVALFNLGGSQFVNTKNALYRSGTISYLTTGHSTQVDVTLPAGSKTLALVVTDGGDSFDSDHADWINPLLRMSDGSTVDLTTLSYTKATCGWGEVHVNQNINGGTLSVNGTTYDRGIATHANSVIVYNLPEGVSGFSALAGIDNTGSDQGSKSSVEFLVYNYDPTDPAQAGPQTYDIDAAVNLTALGFGAGQNCTVTDMWTGENKGNFKNSEYSVHLDSHESALYRISPLGRTGNPAVSISLPGSTQQSGETFDITLAISGGESDNAYFQLISNGKIIGTLPVGADGTAVYKATFLGGDYTLSAKYSGNAKVAAAESSEVSLTVEGPAEDITPFVNRLKTLIETASALDAEKIAGAYRKPLADALAEVQPVEGQNLEQLKASIALLQDAFDNACLSISYIGTLTSLIADAEELAALLQADETRTSLTDAATRAAGVISSDNTTNDDLKNEIDALRAAIDYARTHGVPAEGVELEMTEKITNPSFENGTDGWRWSNSYGGWESVATWSDRPAADGTSFVSLAAGTIKSLDIYQSLQYLPEGIYRLEASLRNTDGADKLTDQHIYATTGGVTLESEPLTTVSGDGNNDWTRLSVDNINVKSGSVLRIGARSTGDGESNRGWFQADDFRLYYRAPAGITSGAELYNGIDVRAEEGCIVVHSDKAATLPVYNTKGMLIDTLQITEGTSRHNINPGAYLTAGHLIIVR